MDTPWSTLILRWRNECECLAPSPLLLDVLYERTLSDRTRVGHCKLVVRRWNMSVDQGSVNWNMAHYTLDAYVSSPLPPSCSAPGSVSVSASVPLPSSRLVVALPWLMLLERCLLSWQTDLLPADALPQLLQRVPIHGREDLEAFD